MSTSTKSTTNQGLGWLHVIAWWASAVVTVVSVNAVATSPTLTNQFVVAAGIVLTVWFGIGTSFSVLGRPVPSTRAFMILLFVMMLLAIYVVFASQLLAIVPGLVALIELVVIVRKL